MPLGFTGHLPQIFCYCQRFRSFTFGVSHSHTPSPLGRGHPYSRFSCFRRSPLGAKVLRLPRPLPRGHSSEIFAYCQCLGRFVFGISPTPREHWGGNTNTPSHSASTLPPLALVTWHQEASTLAPYITGPSITPHAALRF